MNKTQVALIFGSPTAEYSVSLHSAASVMRNFPYADFDLISIAITQQGKWLCGPYTPEDLDADHIADHPQGREVCLSIDPQRHGFYFLDDHQWLAVDCALLVLHGPYGEGGIVQGMLSAAGLPYTGCGVESSVLCMDKAITHVLAEEAGIRMTPYKLIHSYEEAQHHGLGYPCVVKPARNGSSYGVSIVKSESTLETAVEAALKYDNKVLIEAFVTGVEIGCSALQFADQLIISEVDGIYLSDTDYFDFNEKYSSDAATRILCPAPISAAARAEIQALTRQLFSLFGIEQFSRFDFFLAADDVVYLNEINSIPGFTATSRYPRMMAATQISYPEVIRHLVNGAHI